MIEKITSKNFGEVLLLIREYQEFYTMKNIDDEKNRNYFSQFIGDNENGVLHVLIYEGKAIGFSTIYKGFSSTRAETVAILNDLYVQTQYRGKGFGKKLIEHAAKKAKSLGYAQLQWLTAENNKTAQLLYDDMGALKSSWFLYAKET